MQKEIIRKKYNKTKADFPCLPNWEASLVIEYQAVQFNTVFYSH